MESKKQALQRLHNFARKTLTRNEIIAYLEGMLEGIDKEAPAMMTIYYHAQVLNSEHEYITWSHRRENVNNPNQKIEVESYTEFAEHLRDTTNISPLQYAAIKKYKKEK